MADAYRIARNTVLIADAAAGVLANDSDPDGGLVNSTHRLQAFVAARASPAPRAG